MQQVPSQQLPSQQVPLHRRVFRCSCLLSGLWQETQRTYTHLYCMALAAFPCVCSACMGNGSDVDCGRCCFIFVESCGCGDEGISAEDVDTYFRGAEAVVVAVVRPVAAGDLVQITEATFFEEKRSVGGVTCAESDVKRTLLSGTAAAAPDTDGQNLCSGESSNLKSLREVVLSLLGGLSPSPSIRQCSPPPTAASRWCPEKSFSSSEQRLVSPPQTPGSPAPPLPTRCFVVACGDSVDVRTLPRFVGRTRVFGVQFLGPGARRPERWASLRVAHLAQLQSLAALARGVLEWLEGGELSAPPPPAPLPAAPAPPPAAAALAAPAVVAYVFVASKTARFYASRILDWTDGEVLVPLAPHADLETQVRTLRRKPTIFFFKISDYIASHARSEEAAAVVRGLETLLKKFSNKAAKIDTDGCTAAAAETSGGGGDGDGGRPAATDSDPAPFFFTVPVPLETQMQLLDRFAFSHFFSAAQRFLSRRGVPDDVLVPPFAEVPHGLSAPDVASILRSAPGLTFPVLLKLRLAGGNSFCHRLAVATTPQQVAEYATAAAKMTAVAVAADGISGNKTPLKAFPWCREPGDTLVQSFVPHRKRRVLKVFVLGNLVVVATQPSIVEIAAQARPEGRYPLYFSSADLKRDSEFVYEVDVAAGAGGARDEGPSDGAARDGVARDMVARDGVEGDMVARHGAICDPISPASIARDSVAGDWVARFRVSAGADVRVEEAAAAAEPVLRASKMPFTHLPRGQRRRQSGKAAAIGGENRYSENICDEHFGDKKVCEEGCGLETQPAGQSFETAAAADGLDADVDDEDLTAAVRFAVAMRETTRCALMGIDLVERAADAGCAARLAVVDVNYFPSYNGVANLRQKLMAALIRGPSRPPEEPGFLRCSEESRTGASN